MKTYVLVLLSEQVCNPAGTPGYRNGTESFFGLKGRPSVVRDVEIHNQPVLRMRRKPRSRVERLPPSPHVNEPSVTAHYQHYAHDEWSIRGKIIRPYPSPFLVSSPVAFIFLNVLVLNIAETLLAGR